MSERSEQHAGFEVEPAQAIPVGPGSASSFNPQRLDFGHYAGYSIEELAQTDPDYLHWLARHPSGARYRAEISRALGMTLRSTEY